jgi:hypothetical protein
LTGDPFQVAAEFDRLLAQASLRPDAFRDSHRDDTVRGRLGDRSDRQSALGPVAPDGPPVWGETGEEHVALGGSFGPALGTTDGERDIGFRTRGSPVV